MTGGRTQPGCMQPALRTPHGKQRCSAATLLINLDADTTIILTWPARHIIADSSLLLIRLWVTYLLLHLRRSSAHSQTPNR